MEKPEQEHTKGIKEKEWILPAPNVYTYASVISSCARAGQYNETISLLDRIRSSAKDIDSIRMIRPNSWMYNSALASCVPTSKTIDKTNKGHIEIAGQIFQRMEEDCQNGFDCIPDIVTYNTLLSIIRGISQEELKNNSFHDFIVMKNTDIDSGYGHEQLVADILDTMNVKNIAKDPGTYHNAIMSCELHPEVALNILDKALGDTEMLERSKDDGWGSVDRIKLYLINSALSVCCAKGNMSLVSKVFGYIKTLNLKADSDSMMSIVKCLPASGNSDDSMMVLNAMKGDGAANSQCVETYGIDIIGSGVTSTSPIIEERHYSAAITGCLRYGHLFAALKILNAMKLHDLRPNPSSLQGIILAYCKLATDEATLEFREARKEYAQSKARGPVFAANHTISRTRATAALAMMRSLQEAPVKLKCVVASACAATGMWYEAREILWELHISAIREKKRENTMKVIESDQGSAIAELPRLHRSLLKLCARSGNVTAALSFVDTIQDLKTKLEEGSFMQIEDYPDRSSLVNKTNLFATFSASVPVVSPLQHGIGMTGEDWKLLTIAASKSAHWKVCLGTLAFLQPYVEATHPKFASKERKKSSMTRLNKEYDKLSRALTAAVIAFEIRSQYAWALRSIYDWIEWSGRRPPREAIFGVCRILAARGRSSEITSLVAQVVLMKDFSEKQKQSNVLSFETSYEMAIYIEAISVLYNHGFYDAADELYVDAISKGFLPFSIIEETTKSQFKIDLHGMNRAVAHSAVRVSLQHFIQSKKIDRVERDVLIITGKGISSQKHLRPVLRPEVQRMLMEEFYPPLSTSSLPKNMGVLKISSHDMNAWIQHQEEEKGARFLAVAGVLKSITSGSRLKKILSLNLERFPSSSNNTSSVEDDASGEVNL
jgi:pentatricopeptide repeat protein